MLWQIWDVMQWKGLVFHSMRGPNAVAFMAAFLVSGGLFHEWFWSTQTGLDPVYSLFFKGECRRVS